MAGSEGEGIYPIELKECRSLASQVSREPGNLPDRIESVGVCCLGGF